MLDLEKLLKARTGNFSDARKISMHKKVYNWFLFALASFIIILAGFSGRLYHQIQKLESKQKITRRSLKMMGHGIHSSTQRLGNAIVPARLAGIPFGEDEKIILNVKDVNIRNVTAPYNPCLIESSSGYDLFFRYDVINPRLLHANFSSRVGVVSLDRRFEQQDREFTRISLGSEYTDDPRVLMVENELYLFYNQLDENLPKCRFMCAANLDKNTYSVKYKTTLDMNLSCIEKNWSPFEYVGNDQKPRLLIEYKINPRKLLELPNPQINQLNNIHVPARTAYISLPWESKWGKISGGTPSKKIGDEYLGFFHSWFTDENNLAWYVMGAYTFNAAPPFNLTGISKHPILFKKIYETPFANTASIEKRVIFPSGFVLENQNDREIIQLACGENDCGVKIVTIDKENLLKSLQRFE